MARPEIGDRVSVTVTGEITHYDADLGHWFVFGNAPGQDHIKWEWAFHWATEFDVLSPPEPEWRYGDVVRCDDHNPFVHRLYINDGSDWRTPGGRVRDLSDCDLTLVVRDGKPVTQ